MKSLSLLIMVALVQPTFAQEDLRDELNSEIQVLYPKTTLKKKAPAKKVAVRDELNLEEESSSKSVIINNNISAPTADRVTEQPSAVVEASPLEVSKGLETRKQRENIEKSTEDSIVQQLEKDRIEAEKERAKKAQEIFNREEKNNEVVAPVAPVYVAPVQEVAPVVAPTQTVKAEVEQTLSQETEKTEFYIGGVGGYGDYSTASNVDGKFAMGLNFGVIFPEGFILESSAIWSQYDIHDQYTCYQFDYFGNCMMGSIVPISQRMTQWNIGVAGKYAFLKGRVRPIVGALMSYTHRSFENKYNATNMTYYSNTRQNNPSDSKALDGGLSVGVDIRITEKFHIGSELKYMMNLTYDRDDNPQTRNYGNTQPIEELSYYMFGVQGSYRF